jgi:hypothetical protein
MIAYRRTAIVLLLILLPFISIAQESSFQTKTDTINHIVEETSISGELNQPIDELETQFLQNPFGLPSAKNEQMMDLYSDAFQPESTLKTIRSIFSDKFNAGHADSVISWLNKPNTQNVHKFEKEFYTLQGIRKRIVSQYELEQNPPSENRTQLIQSLAQKRSAVETELEARASIFRALVTAFGELSVQQSFSSSQIEGIVGNFRNQIRPQIDEQVANHLMTKYHGVDDDKLKQYISFYDTEPGQWLTDTTSESIHTALESAADQFLSSINDIDSE